MLLPLESNAFDAVFTAEIPIHKMGLNLLLFFSFQMFKVLPHLLILISVQGLIQVQTTTISHSPLHRHSNQPVGVTNVAVSQLKDMIPQHFPHQPIVIYTCLEQPGQWPYTNKSDTIVHQDLKWPSIQWYKESPSLTFSPEVCILFVTKEVFMLWK